MCDFDGPFALTHIQFYAAPVEPLAVYAAVEERTVANKCDARHYIALVACNGIVCCDAYLPRGASHIAEAKQFLLDLVELRYG